MEKNDHKTKYLYILYKTTSVEEIKQRLRGEIKKVRQPINDSFLQNYTLNVCPGFMVVVVEIVAHHL